MDRRLLGYFLAVCDEKNITRAAERMFLTRQALSGHMRSLESELGKKLFVRSKAGVELTREGELLREYAEHEAVLWETMTQRMNQAGNEVFFRAGIHLTHVNSNFVKSVLSYRCPDRNAYVSIIGSEDYKAFWQMLRDEWIDVAITRKTPEDSSLGFIRKPGALMDVMFIMREDDPLAFLDEVDFDRDISGRTCITISQDTLEESAPHLRRVGATGLYAVPDRTLVMELVREKKALFAVPEEFLASFLEDGFTARRVPNYPVHSENCVAFRTNPSPELRRFIDYLVSIPWS